MGTSRERNTNATKRRSLAGLSISSYEPTQRMDIDEDAVIDLTMDDSLGANADMNARNAVASTSNSVGMDTDYVVWQPSQSNCAALNQLMTDARELRKVDMLSAGPGLASSASPASSFATSRSSSALESSSSRTQPSSWAVEPASERARRLRARRSLNGAFGLGADSRHSTVSGSLAASCASPIESGVPATRLSPAMRALSRLERDPPALLALIRGVSEKVEESAVQKSHAIESARARGVSQYGRTKQRHRSKQEGGMVVKYEGNTSNTSTTIRVRADVMEEPTVMDVDKNPQHMPSPPVIQPHRANADSDRHDASNKQPNSFGYTSSTLRSVENTTHPPSESIFSRSLQKSTPSCTISKSYQSVVQPPAQSQSSQFRGPPALGMRRPGNRQSTPLSHGHSPSELSCSIPTRQKQFRAPLAKTRTTSPLANELLPSEGSLGPSSSRAVFRNNSQCDMNAPKQVIRPCARSRSDASTSSSCTSLSGPETPIKDDTVEPISAMKEDRSSSPAPEADTSFSSTNFDMGIDEDELERACSMYD